MRVEIEEMLTEIREAVGRCRGPSEREVMEALVCEAEGWNMRLEELEDEGSDE